MTGGLPTWWFWPAKTPTSKRINEEVGWAIRKSTDQSVTSSTTFVNDSVLTWPVDANVNYLWEMNLVYTGAAAADIKIGWGVPAGALASWSAAGLDAALAYQNFGNQSESSTGVFGCMSTTLGRLIQIAGYLSVDSTCGNFTLRFAQNSSNASPTVMRAGSAGILYRV